jgi:hypothetical protein
LGSFRREIGRQEQLIELILGKIDIFPVFLFPEHDRQGNAGDIQLCVLLRGEVGSRVGKDTNHGSLLKEPKI